MSYGFVSSIVEVLESRRLLSFGAAGSPFRVNSGAAGHQTYPAVASNADGTFVVTWTSNNQDGDTTGIYARRYNSTGTAVGSEFLVNSFTTGPQTLPDVAIDAAGDFVVVWQSYVNQDGSLWGVYGQHYSAAGEPVGGEFQINVVTSLSQVVPSVAMNGDGDFVVAWRSHSTGAESWDIFARRYDAAGVPQGGEIAVNTYTTGEQGDPSTAIDDAGNFVVAWKSVGQDGDGAGAFARTFDLDGQPLSPEIQLNQHFEGDQLDPAVAMNSSGIFVSSWLVIDQPGVRDGVFARRFALSGTPLGDEFRATNRTNDFHTYPAVSMDSAGNFVLVWAGREGLFNNDYIHAKRFDSSGTPLGIEFRVALDSIHNAGNSAIAMRSQGEFVVAWQANNQDSDGFAIRAQRFDEAQASVVPAVGISEFRWATGQSIRFTFNADVRFSTRPDDLILENLTSGQFMPESVVNLSWHPSNAQVDFSFPTLPNAGALPTGRYRATLNGADISNSAGTTMEADGIVEFFFVNGDVNHDATVDITDLGILATNWQKSVNSYSAGDLDNSGQVDITDLGILASNWQVSLPPPLPGPVFARSASVSRASALVDSTQRTTAATPKPEAN